MDALTDVLKTVHLTGSLYFRSELSAPWGMSVPQSEAAQFHIIRRGRCWLRNVNCESEFPLRLESGDLVVLPHGNAHDLVDDPQTRFRAQVEDLVEPLTSVARGPLHQGDSSPKTSLICGYFHFESGHVHPLLSVLPELIHIRGDTGEARRWLESPLELIAREIEENRPGAETVINRLTETVFIQVLRSHLDSGDHGNANWLYGLKDPQISRSLGLIHRMPEQSWTVAALAAQAGMSRSAFSTRFRALVGDSPLQYLIRWRMELAAIHLRDPSLSLSEIATRVGYQTEAAFSKVFKKSWGAAPRTFRRRAQYNSVEKQSAVG